MAEYFVGRQPIFDRKNNVFAYELLYRSVGQSNKATIVDGDQATSQVIINTFSEKGLDNIVGPNNKAFINATRNILLGNFLKTTPSASQKITEKYTNPLPPSRVVLEVLENIKIDTPIIEAIQGLVQAGYCIALDDVISVKQISPLLGFAQIIKIDLMGIDQKQLPNMVATFKQYDIQLLAEKVETQQEFKNCLDLGFDYFQGYYFSKPDIIKGRRLDASQIVALRSLSKLQDPKASFPELEEVIAQDVVLGYKLLKLVNSGYYSLSTQVKSIRQAISFIGINQLRAWITLLLMAGVDNKPHELTTVALQRAKMCEMFASAKKREQVETYFLMGLLSVLDALMDMSMEQVVANIPLSPEVAEGLLTRKGSYGDILHTVIAYEQGKWETVLKLNLNSETIRSIYLDSIHWASVLTKDMYSKAG